MVSQSNCFEKKPSKTNPNNRAVIIPKVRKNNNAHTVNFQ